MRLLICFSLLFSSCASQPNLVQLLNVASVNGMQGIDVASHGFVIRTYQRLLNNNAPIHVYIEGDGFAYITAAQTSNDPTPHMATGLALALADNAANVVYLARPCQYTLAQSPGCNVAFWTSARFSEPIIAAMNDALNQIKQAHGTQKIALIGYSGGGAVAVLLAARRTDIQSLRTVAGNLNHQVVNQLHHVSPMPQSLNAIDVVSQIRHIPQVHFVGMQDTVIPRFIAQQFAKKVGTCAQVNIVENANHSDGWQENWPQLMQQIPSCQ